MKKQQPIDRRVEIGGQIKRIRANSEQEFVDKIIAILNGNESVAVGNGKHDFAAYAKNWFETFSKPNVDTATAITYERQLDNIWLPAFEGKTVEEISLGDVQAVFNDMGDVAKETKTKARSVLSMIFDQAIEDGYIKRNLTKSKNLKIRGRSAEKTEPYTIGQMQYLVAHIDDVKNPMDRAYLALHCMHPLRPEEVYGLKYRDIDFDNSKINITHVVTHPDRNQPVDKETKTESSVRSIDLVPQIKRYLPKGSPDDYILGGEKALSYTRIRRMCNRIKKDIGFEDSIVPSRFRTTVLTDLYDMTKDITVTQAAAGHTTAEITLKYYVKGRGDTADTATPVASRYGLTA